jgi:hypothetical protein
MQHPHKISEAVLAISFSGVGLAIAKSFKLIDWQSVLEAAIKSATWTVSGLIVTVGFNAVLHWWRNRNQKSN